MLLLFLVRKIPHLLSEIQDLKASRHLFRKNDLKSLDIHRADCRTVLGAHATHIVLSLKDVMRIEHSDDPIKIGALPLNYMTSWGLLKHSGVKLPPGSSILIGAASGGVGTAIAQLVTAFGSKFEESRFPRFLNLECV